MILDFILNLFTNAGIISNVNQPTTRVLYKVEKNQKPYVPESACEESKLRRKIIELTFRVMFVTHALYEDDDHLSLSEKNEIKDLFKDKIQFLTKEDINYIKKIVKSQPSATDLIDYAKAHQIDFDFVDKTIELVRIIARKSNRYDSVLDRVERRFIMEKEYL